MDWKENFDGSTLMEGRRILQNHLAGNILQDGDIYQSTIYDPWTRTDNLVQARIHDGTIEAIDCSCPAGAHGEFCRHEAAFLFGIEDQMDNQPAEEGYPHQPAHRPETGPKPEPARSETRQESTLEDYLRKLAELRGAEPEAGYKSPVPQAHAIKEPVKPVTKKEPEPSAKKAEAPVHKTEKPVRKAAPMPENPEKPAETKDEKSGRNAKGPLQTMIDALSETQIRSFLFQEARSNPAFRQRLELEFLKEAPDDLLDTWYSGLDALIYSSQDANGMISRARSARVLQSVQSWLLSRIGLLLDHDHPREAFALISYAFDALGDLRFEDVEQSTDELSAALCGELAKAIQEADLSLSDEIFTWIEVKLSQKHLSQNQKKALIALLDSLFLQGRYTARKLSVLEQLLAVENERSKNSRFDTALRDQLIRQMDTLFASDDQYPDKKAEFESQIKDTPVFRQIQIQKAIDLNDLENARILLMEALSKAPKGSLEAAVLMRKLAALLKQEGKDDAALDVLRTLISKNTHIISDDLEMLKAMVSEEEFLSAMKALHNTVSPLTLAEVYADGNLDEALMDLIEEKRDLLLLELYETRLLKQFGGRMLSLWLERADDKAASNRSSDYSEAVYALKKASALPEGAQKAKELARTLSEQHPHKRSLIYRLEEAALLD